MQIERVEVQPDGHPREPEDDTHGGRNAAHGRGGNRDCEGELGPGEEEERNAGQHEADPENIVEDEGDEGSTVVAVVIDVSQLLCETAPGFEEAHLSASRCCSAGMRPRGPYSSMTVDFEPEHFEDVNHAVPVTPIERRTAATMSAMAVSPTPRWVPESSPSLNVLRRPAAVPQTNTD